MVIPEDEKSETQKLEEDVMALKTRIKNTEYDLAHMFKGNDIIKQKLVNTQGLLTEKENLLLNLSGKRNTTPTEKVKELEENITESKEEPITEDQKRILDEELEKEFM